MKILKSLMVFFMFLLISACGGGSEDGSSGSDIASSNHPLAIKSIPTYEKAPSLEGFDFTFKTGDFWEYQWEKAESSSSSTSYGTIPPSYSEKAGVIKISLGEPMRIMGVIFYKIEIEYSGDAKESDASITWQYIASHSNVLYGYKNTEGRSDNGVYKIFDAQNKYWQGGTLMGGIFGAGLENLAPELSAVAREYGVYRVRYPKSPSLSAIGVYSYSAEEIFKHGVGLIEKSYSTSSRNTFSGSTFTSSTKSSWKLIHSSFGI